MMRGVSSLCLLTIQTLSTVNTPHTETDGVMSACPQFDELRSTTGGVDCGVACQLPVGRHSRPTAATT